ncbi:MAG: aldo/keto reductase [Caldilineaceae bacterium]|nr:aldo/keto reductase [Caldilineaceae bacterium]
MQYTTLGRTGLRVSTMGLGCGGPSRVGLSTGKSEAEQIQLVQQALAAGVNFIDTAESYQTEAMVGKAIQGHRRAEVIISTKKSTGQALLTPAQVQTGLEASLKRLGTDYIDVYHLHGVRPEQYEDLVAAVGPTLQQLRQQGKIRFIGITELTNSDPNHTMLQRALQDDLWEVMMVGFNLLNQSARQRVFAETQAKGIGVLIMFAVRLALSRPARLQEVLQELAAKGEIDPQEFDQADPLGFLVREGGAVSVPDAAYRFCRDEPGAHVVLVGTGNPDHLQENLASFDRPPLTPAVVARVQQLFRRVDSVSGQ